MYRKGRDTALEVLGASIANETLRIRQSTQKERTVAAQVDRHETQEMLKKEGAQLVDVLSSKEYEVEHLPGALNIPLKALNRDSTQRLDPGRPVIVYCHDYQ
jgi:3-mercaptopyruvate sulfurtransferase SseA